MDNSQDVGAVHGTELLNVAGAPNEEVENAVASTSGAGIDNANEPFCTILILNLKTGLGDEKKRNLDTILGDENPDVALLQGAHMDLCQKGMFPGYQPFEGAARESFRNENGEWMPKEQIHPLTKKIQPDLDGRLLTLVRSDSVGTPGALVTRRHLQKDQIPVAQAFDDVYTKNNDCYIRFQRIGSCINVHNGNHCFALIKLLPSRMKLSSIPATDPLVLAGSFNRMLDPLDGKESTFQSLKDLLTKQNLVDVVHDHSREHKLYYTLKKGFTGSKTGRNDRIYIRNPNMSGDHARMHVICVYNREFQESNHDAVVCKLRMIKGEQQRCRNCFHKDPQCPGECQNPENRCNIWLSTCPKCKKNVHVTKPDRCKDPNYLTRCSDRTFHPLGVWCTNCESAHGVGEMTAGMGQMSVGAAEATPVASGDPALARARALLRELEELGPALDHPDLPTFLHHVREARRSLPRDGH